MFLAEELFLNSFISASALETKSLLPIILPFKPDIYLMFLTTAPSLRSASLSSITSVSSDGSNKL